MVIQRTEQVGGILAAGISAAGNPNGLGLVRDLSVEGGSLGSGSVSFAWDGAADGVAFHSYIDGVPNTETSPEAGWEIEPLGEGVFDVDVVPRDATTAVSFLAPDLIGNKAFLRWDAPATDADRVIAYRIYRGEDLVGTVDRIDVGAPVVAAQTGTGGPIVTGSWTIEGHNETLSLEVIEGGLWTLKRGDGSLLAAGEVIPGVPQSTASGVYIEWAAGDYEEGDKWEIPVEVRRFWVSPEEGAGTFVYTVKAVDLTSAESEGEDVTVQIGGIPDPPIATFSWDAEERELTVSFEGAPSTGFARIYLNWDAATESLTQYVEEAGHQARIAGSSGTWVLSIPAGVEGSIRGYVRSENAAGVVERNAAMLTAPLIADGETSLPAPEIVSVEPAPGERFLIAWRIDLQPGGLSEVRLYSGATSNPQTLDEVVPLALTVNDFPVAELQFLTDETYASAVFFALEAVWPDGLARSSVVGPVIPIEDGAGDVENLEGWEN